MAVFAGDAFGDFEFAALLFGFCVESVADETFWGFFGFGAELQNVRHAFANVAGECLIRAAVFVFQNPGGVFGLEDAAAGNGTNAAVAARGRTGTRADIFHRFGGGRFCLRGKRRGKQRCKGAESRSHSNYKRAFVQGEHPSGRKSPFVYIFGFA